MKRLLLDTAAIFVPLNASSPLRAQNTALQQVEGFGAIVFSHDTQGSGTLTRSSVDFRGQHPGGWTAPWWAPGPMSNNTLVWKKGAAAQRQRLPSRLWVA